MGGRARLRVYIVSQVQRRWRTVDDSRLVPGESYCPCGNPFGAAWQPGCTTHATAVTMAGGHYGGDAPIRKQIGIQRPGQVSVEEVDVGETASQYYDIRVQYVDKACHAAGQSLDEVAIMGQRLVVSLCGCRDDPPR